MSVTSFDLSGEWEFRLQSKSEPLDEAFSLPGYAHPAWGLIGLPASPPRLASSVPEPESWIGSYRREVEIPEDGVGKTWQLVLDGAVVRELFVNGRRLEDTGVFVADARKLLVCFIVRDHPQSGSPVHSILLRRA